MKLVELHEDYDLSANLRRDPSDDKFGKMVSDKYDRRPSITLRHINKLKKMKQAQRDEHDQRKKILDIMYGIPTEGGE